MAKSKLPRMQHLPGEIICEAWRVNFVAKDWVTEMMKMHANLMGPSAVQQAFDQTGALARPNNAILGSGRASSPSSRAHSLSMNRMSPDFFFDYTGRFGQFSSDQRKINLFYRAFGKLLG